MMTHFNELHLILNKYLKWNKSRVKCFTLIMLALIVKQTCNLSSASKALPITCLPQSFYRRMQRFFAGQYFDYRQISQLIFNMFSFDQVQLTLDRTNWKWGKRNINILIRSIQKYQDQLSVWAGGGITIASDAEAEYQECFDKISAMLDLLNTW